MAEPLRAAASRKSRTNSLANDRTQDALDQAAGYPATADPIAPGAEAATGNGLREPEPGTDDARSAESEASRIERDSAVFEARRRVRQAVRETPPPMTATSPAKLLLVGLAGIALGAFLACAR